MNSVLVITSKRVLASVTELIDHVQEPSAELFSKQATVEQ